jgi:hypothetical protein
MQVTREQGDRDRDKTRRNQKSEINVEIPKCETGMATKSIQQRETRKEKDRNVSDSSAPVDVGRRGREFE